MDSAVVSLQSVLVLLASSVLAVAVCRSLQLPPMIGYLATGLALGPHALGLVSGIEETRRLAEFGVVFLMFSIGLEFSLPKLLAMRRAVFGLGLAQVSATIALALGAALAAGASWQAGLTLGGIAAMSSPAMVSRLLAERLELDTAHGRQVIGMLLFQDLAVVPLLVLLPALDQSADALGAALAIALGKAVLALAVVITLGPRLMRAWLGIVARRRSNALFVLNVLLVTLLLAFVTGLAGLSLVLGAFLAGMLISETEFRFQVEEDIKPFRDVLLGLFFVTVGMMLDLRLVLGEFPLVMLLFALLVGAKFALIALLSSAFGSAPGTALRVGIALAQAGEFGFVLLSLAAPTRVVPEPVLQGLLAAMILSMLATPFLIAASDRIVMRLSGAEWMLRSLELHRIAAQAIEVERHVIVLGYGRNGQRLARLLDAEGVRYVALDLDPERVRARDEDDIPRLTAAGASEVVPEAFESGVMLASHTLVLVGVPLSRVMRRMSQVRGEQYQLLRGLFHGSGDELDGDGEALARLHSVTLDEHAHALGRPLAQLGLDALGVQVRAVRRRGARSKLTAAGAGALQAGDVVVLLGDPESLAAAEVRLLRG